MSEVKFPLFIKNQKNRLSRSFWIFSLCLGSLLILWLNQEFLNLELVEFIFYPIVWIGWLSYIFFLFYSMNEKEKLNGNFVGYLIFDLEKVIAGEKEFRLSEIQKLEFTFSDFDGMKWTNLRSPEPKVSNGVNNRATVKFKNGTYSDFYFYQDYEDEFEMKMRDLLISFHLQDKISFLALIQYIGISDDYERIQEFKKELQIMKDSEKEN